MGLDRKRTHDIGDRREYRIDSLRYHIVSSYYTGFYISSNMILLGAEMKFDDHVLTDQMLRSMFVACCDVQQNMEGVSDSQLFPENVETKSALF